MTGRILVEVSDGGSYAPCMYHYRIVSERLHRRAMRAACANGAPSPQDEYGRDDNVLMSYDSIVEIVPRRYMRDLENGWSVRFLLDRWEAFAYYGYDASEAA